MDVFLIGFLVGFSTGVVLAGLLSAGYLGHMRSLLDFYETNYRKISGLKLRRNRLRRILRNRPAPNIRGS